MSTYTFKLACAADKNEIIEFMDKNWGEKHPLLHVPEFFAFYYEAKHELQFALCLENGAIVAVAGYVFANNTSTPDAWVSILCAQKGKTGAGLELLSSFPSLLNPRIMCCNNVRKKALALYSFVGYSVARLPHFYRLNTLENYNIATPDKSEILPVKNGLSLLKITSERELNDCYIEDKSLKPFKDLWYISRRYFNYPLQKYDVWKLDGESITNELLVTRTVNVDGINVLRVVDYIGKPENFVKFGYGIDLLLKTQNAEYVDMYCHGIDLEIINKAGFTERNEDSEAIIPNYLTPLLKENVEYYFSTTDTDGFTMFKADGDQDRPNIELKN